MKLKPIPLPLSPNIMEILSLRFVYCFLSVAPVFFLTSLQLTEAVNHPGAAENTPILLTAIFEAMTQVQSIYIEQVECISH